MRLFPKHSDGWLLWRWIDERLILFSCPWFQVAMHWIHKAQGESLHDHPFSFWGFILKGSYTEVVGQPDGDKLINTHLSYQNYFVHKNPTTAHAIVAVEPGGCISLVLIGPVRKGWSLFTPLGKKPGNGDVLMIETPQ